MEISEYIKHIPDLVNLFVPGYVFLSVCNYLTKNESKSFEITAISSLIISYIIQLVIGLLKLPALYNNILAILSAFILALIVIRLRISSVYKSVLIKLGKVTGKNNIWEDFFDKNKGTKVRFYTTIDNKNVSVIGDIKLYEVNNDNECTFIINNYMIEYSDGSIINSTDPEFTMIFNTKNINGLEAHYGQPHN